MNIFDYKKNFFLMESLKKIYDKYFFTNNKNFEIKINNQIILECDKVFACFLFEDINIFLKENPNSTFYNFKYENTIVHYDYFEEENDIEFQNTFKTPYFYDRIINSEYFLEENFNYFIENPFLFINLFNNIDEDNIIKIIQQNNYFLNIFLNFTEKFNFKKFIKNFFKKNFNFLILLNINLFSEKYIKKIFENQKKKYNSNFKYLKDLKLFLKVFYNNNLISNNLIKNIKLSKDIDLSCNNFYFKNKKYSKEIRLHLKIKENYEEVIFEFKEKLILPIKYFILNNIDGNIPLCWKIYSSLNKKDWNLIDEQFNQLNSNERKEISFEIKIQKICKFIKLEPIDLKENEKFEIEHIKFYGKKII